MTSLDHLWCPSPAMLTLSSAEVHVWRACLEPALTSCLEYLRHTLSADELQRAARFHFPRDRRRLYRRPGGCSGTSLSCYLGVPPSELGFRYSAYGKPALADDFDARGCAFNISHSHEMALFAVTCGREVGIDIEYLGGRSAVRRSPNTSFSAQERANLRALPCRGRSIERSSTAGRGRRRISKPREGLSLPLDQFDVSLAPGEPAALPGHA